MTLPEYPFEEFARHFDDLHDDGRLAPNEFMQNAITIRQFMESQYEESEAAYKAMKFMAIAMYLSDHVEDFDNGEYGVNASRETGALISEHVFRAVHHLLTTTKSLNPSPDEVMSLADRFKSEESGVPVYRIDSDPRTSILRKLIEARFPSLTPSKTTTIGIIASVLKWTAENAPNGDLSTYSPEVIATAIEWEGDAQVLIDILSESGFLDESRKLINLDQMFSSYEGFYRWALGDE